MRTSIRLALEIVPAVALAFSSCARNVPPETVTPERPVGALPPIPAVDGALKIDVVAPGEGEGMPSRDSTFIYGSVGTGKATLTIDGAPVKVEPNGTFLAWLGIPADGAFHLAASANGQSASVDRHVKLPGLPTSLPRDRARILEGTVYPGGSWVVLPGERVDVGFRGTPGGRAYVVMPDGARYPLVEAAAVQEAVTGAMAFEGAPQEAQRTLPGVSSYSGFFIARPLVSPDTGSSPRLAAAPAMPPVAAPPAPAPDTDQVNTPLEAAAAARRADARAAAARGAGREPGVGRKGAKTFTRRTGKAAAERAPAPVRPALPARFANGLTTPRAAGAAVLELVVGTDTARTPLPLTVAVMERPRVGVASPSAPDQTHRGVVVGRATTAGPYNWFWPAGTRLALTGERGGMYRVALADQRSAWVSASEVRLLPEGTPPPFSRVGTVRFNPQRGWIDARFALSQRLPYRVDETLDAITVTLYGGQSDTDYMQYGALDPLIRYAEWRQQTDSIYTLTVNLTRSVWGYQTFFAENGDLVLRIRRPPQIDAARPLRGLRIMLDPGHPPGGAIGPTRLTEAEANLAIAMQLRPLLEREGATVLMTRTTNEAVPLNQRPQMAQDSNADILLSIHNNGLPNGVNPFGNTGTSDYYFHPRSAELAQDLDREIARELGTLDLGVGRADLALVRPTWMPAVLTETMYLMVPQQEAALRNPAVQERIAEAHLRGLLDFLRKRARETTEATRR